MAGAIKRKWTVEGKDSHGQVKRITVLAGDEGQASAAVSMRGIQVLRVYAYDPDALLEMAREEAEAPPDDVGFSPPPAARKTPPKAKEEASELRGTASRLRAIDIVLSVAGYVYILSSLIAAFAICLQYRNEMRDPWLVAAYMLAIVVAGAVSGVILLGVGAAFRMLAIMGEDTRESKQLNAGGSR